MEATLEEKRSLLRQFLRTPKGRERLAEAMVGWFETRIRYTCLWGRLLEEAEGPFCEPVVYEEDFYVDPEDLDTTYGNTGEARKVLASRIDADLVAKFYTDEIEWDERVVNDSESLTQIFEDHREMAVGSGFILTDARTYADFRKFGRDILDIETCRPLPHMAGFVNMAVWAMRAVPTGDVLFVPKPAGRWADVFEVEALGPPGREVEGRRLPEFRLRMKVCMEVDPSKVKAVRYKWEEA